MNGNKSVIDTNGIIYYIQGKECIKPYVSNYFIVSVITEIESLSFSELTEEDEKLTKTFIRQSKKLYITDDIKDETIRLRRKYNIKTPDAIIAATAIVNDVPLITADKGFKKIEELDLILLNP